MRVLYTEADRTQSPQTTLLPFAARRREIYLSTIHQIELMHSQQQTRLDQVKSLGIQSLANQLMGGATDAVRPYYYPSPFGPATGPYSGHRNVFSAQAAAYEQQMLQVGRQGSMDPATMIEIKALEERWRAVE